MTIQFTQVEYYNGRQYGINAVLTLPDNEGKGFIAKGTARAYVPPTALKSYPSSAPGMFITAEDATAIIAALSDVTSKLAALTSALSAGNPSLRVTPIASVSTAVTGTLAVSTIANFGTGIPAKETVDDMNNMVVTLANIQNVTV